MFEYNHLMKWRPALLTTSLCLTVLLLVACSTPAADRELSPVAATAAIEVEGETVTVIETVEVEVVEEELVEEPVLPTEVIQPQPTALPSLAPTQEIIVIQVTSAPVVRDFRLIELTWPSHILLGDSDEVRLTFNPSQDSVEVIVEDATDEGQTVERAVSVRHIEGYQTTAAAVLDGVGFDVSPAGEQSWAVTPGEPLVWRWTVAPQQSGRQHLAITLILRWTPLENPALSVRESVILSKGLDIPVLLPAETGSSSGLMIGVMAAATGAGLILIFALRYRPQAGRRQVSGHAVTVGVPNRELSIEPQPDIELVEPELEILQALFSRYQRLVLEQ